MNREVLQNILLVVFGLALILVGYAVFAQYQSLNELSSRTASVSVAVNETTDVVNDLTTKVDGLAMQVQENAMLLERVRMLVGDCASLGAGWSLYQSNTVDLSFCVNSAWGTIREELENFAPEAAEGRMYRVTFGTSNPNISYSSQDFRKLLDSDSPDLDWNMIDFSKTEAELSADFTAFERVELGEGEYINVTKTTVDGKNALKVESRITHALTGSPVHSFNWYIPDSVSDGTYNLQIYTDTSTASDVQLLVDSLKIN